jgi:hypothetical protein
VYCYALQFPGKSLRLQSLRPKEDSKILMFGETEPVKWHFDSAQGLVIDVPESVQQHKENEYAWGWTVQVA